MRMQNAGGTALVLFLGGMGLFVLGFVVGAHHAASDFANAQCRDLGYVGGYLSGQGPTLFCAERPDRSAR